MGFYLLYIRINLLGHIHKDGVSVTLNITRDRILESNITPISICLFVYCSNGRIDCTLCQQFRFVQKEYCLKPNMTTNDLLF